MRELKIKKEFNNKKIISILNKEFPNLKNSTIYKALRKKDILINGKRISENITVKENDIVKLYISDDLIDKTPSITKLPKIIFEDSNILIIDKPTNIEVTGENSLTTQLTNHFNYPVYPCHRLDRNTSGLILYAKNTDSLDILLDKFKKHEIQKKYLCTVYGIPSENHKILNAYLFKDAKKSQVYISDVPKKGYLTIKTEYSLISKNQNDNTSILEITLHTGRTHQIRAHLAHIGYPILGDGKYGSNQINKKFNLKTQQLKSTSLTFNFKTDAKILNYLNKKTFSC